MKKLFCILLILALTLGLVGCAPANDPAESSALTAQLPSQSTVNSYTPTDYVGTNEKGEYRLEPGGGDGNDWFYSRYILKVNSIDSLWYNLVDSQIFDTWSADYKKQLEDGSLDMTYPYLIKFFKDMQITREQANQVIAYMEEKNLLRFEHALQFADLDIIFTWDAELINQTYATEYSVYANGKVYSPQWILNHTAEDYKAAGITAQQLEPKMQKYLEELGRSHATYQTMYTQKLNDLKALEK